MNDNNDGDHLMTTGVSPSSVAEPPIRQMRYGDPRDKRGYLRKEGKMLKLKTKRFLCLSGKMLSHQRDEGSPATWTVDVTNLRAMAGPRVGELVLMHEDRAVSFFANDKEELNEWMLALKSARSRLDDWYTLGKEIGKGSYGSVHLGMDKATHEKVAIKLIKKNPSSKRQSKFIEREIKILKSVDNPHVIVTLDVFEDERQLALVSEYMEGGELFDRIIQEKSFTEEKAREVMRQVLVGVEYLHSLQIVHRDIKPENILCQSKDWPYQVKLTDFGLSNVIEDAVGDYSNALLSHVGTSFYLAPEVVGKAGYGPGVDVWACGVVLYIMLCGRFPFWGKSDIEYLTSLQRGPDMSGEGWDSVSNEGKQYVRQLLELNPKHRPTASMALNLPWMRAAREVSADNEVSATNLRKLQSQAGLKAVVQQKQRQRLSQTPQQKAKERAEKEHEEKLAREKRERELAEKEGKAKRYDDDHEFATAIPNDEENNSGNAD